MQIDVIPSDTFDRGEPLMRKMWGEHSYCLKWSKVDASFTGPLPIFPLTPAFTFHVSGFKMFCQTKTKGVPRAECPMARFTSMRGRVMEKQEPGDHSLLDRLPGHSERAEHCRERGRVSVWGHYMSYINERLQWQSILGTVLLLYTKRAFGLFKILPPIGRKIIHSWVMKWHLCSAASWSHLIPLDLI